MVKSLVRVIIKQFIDIIEETSIRCQIEWNKCDVKIVSRQFIDSLVIEFYNKRNIVDCLDVFLPKPLITIDFTNIRSDNINNEIWILYLERKASELLTKLIDPLGNNPFNVCCPPKKCERVPKNPCNKTYREEFYLCKPKKPICIDKPYNEWGKPCKIKNCKDLFDEKPICENFDCQCDKKKNRKKKCSDIEIEYNKKKIKKVDCPCNKKKRTNVLYQDFD